MRVVLRDFVARGIPPAGQPADVRGETLWKFIIAELPETLRVINVPQQPTAILQPRL
jgi:hypothetical protein